MWCLWGLDWGGQNSRPAYRSRMRGRKQIENNATCDWSVNCEMCTNIHTFYIVYNMLRLFCDTIIMRSHWFIFVYFKLCTNYIHTSGAGLHSLDEPGELSKWLEYDDSTKNIVQLPCIIIIISAVLSNGPGAPKPQGAPNSRCVNFFFHLVK